MESLEREQQEQQQSSETQDVQQTQNVVEVPANEQQSTVVAVPSDSGSKSDADALNQISSKLDGLSGSLEQQREQIGGIADTTSDLTVTKMEQSRDASAVTETVQLDSTQYEYLVESFKLSNSLCLVSFLMLCMAVGVMLAGRFLGGVARG